MASSAFLFYESQQEIGDHTWYYLRVQLVHNSYEYLIEMLLDLIKESIPDELNLLDLPITAPAFVPEGTELDKYSIGGTYTLPEDIYFMYGEGNAHVRQVYPDEPEEVVIQNAYFADVRVVYRDAPYTPPAITWPEGRDPNDTQPDESGWVFPDDLEDWGYEEKSVAVRYLYPWYYTDLMIQRSFIYSGCTDWPEDENHMLMNEVYDRIGMRFNWNEPNFIYCCKEEDHGYYYWIERDITGETESVSIWLFESDVPALYYPNFDLITPSKRMPIFQKNLLPPDIIKDSPAALVLGSFFLKKLSIRDVENLLLSGEPLTMPANPLQMRP